MSLVEVPVAVSVPATSANVGPGYDCLGLALELRDVYTAALVDRPGVQVEVFGQGAGVVAVDEANLVADSLLRGLTLFGEAPPLGIRLRCRNQVPHARGLGSSSAAIVGGLALARELAGVPLPAPPDRKDYLPVQAAGRLSRKAATPSALSCDEKQRQKRSRS